MQPDIPLADLGIDSLDALNIIFEVEEAFGITVPDETARSMRTTTTSFRPSRAPSRLTHVPAVVVTG